MSPDGKVNSWQVDGLQSHVVFRWLLVSLDLPWTLWLVCDVLTEPCIAWLGPDGPVHSRTTTVLSPLPSMLKEDKLFS